MPSLALAVQSLAEDRLDAAAWHAAEAVYASPDDPAAHALQGFVHDLAGRTAAAAGAYRAALYLDPTLFQVRLLLADCLLRLGIEDRAEHHFREVLAVLDSGRARSLDALAAVPLPDRAGATHRSRQALRGRHRTAL